MRLAPTLRLSDAIGSDALTEVDLTPHAGVDPMQLTNRRPYDGVRVAGGVEPERQPPRGGGLPPGGQFPAVLQRPRHAATRALPAGGGARSSLPRAQHQVRARCGDCVTSTGLSGAWCDDCVTPAGLSGAWCDDCVTPTGLALVRGTGAGAYASDRFDVLQDTG
eukprot:8031259-Pyramimonas_sp.AAC.1